MREELNSLIEKYWMAKDFELARFIEKKLKTYFEDGFHTFYVGTSNLGYDRGVFLVKTTLPLVKFKEIDSKYGMKYRHESTTIDQLKEGALKEGYEFDYEVIIPANGIFNSKSREYLIDYQANSGNY